MEVLRSNFEEQFPFVEKSIRQADFIALDTEFTGLRINDQQKSSLFDTSEDRYKNLRQTVTQITVSQLGLSTFTKDSKENKYVCKSYNFYMCPQSFGPIDVRFICQASSLQFLCKYNFDFNKFIYEGISSLNEDQERLVRQHVDSRAMFTGLERDIDEKLIQKICSRVAEWVVASEDRDTFVLKEADMEGMKPFVVSSELRGRFPSVWTTQQKNQVIVEKITPERRQTLEVAASVEEQQHESRVMDEVLGFTRVFRILKECKKPLLGHNMLMDLLLLYDKFHKPLPESYKQFKNELHLLFPRIYDTKHIASSLYRSFEESGMLQSTSLSDLYKGLSSTKGREFVIHSPGINHAKGFDKYEGDSMPHEAGFDAYMCGVVFLRLAHIVTFRQVLSTEVIPCSFRRYVQCLTSYVNKVNLIRATTNHMCLDGPDVASVRPELLYVSSRQLKKLNPDQLAKWFSPYGSVDIRLEGRSRALVATGNYRCAKDILKSFHRHNLVYVTKYNMWRHSTFVRGCLWTCAVVSGGLCVWALLAGKKTPD